MKNLLLVLFAGLIFMSCNKDQRSEDEMISDFIEENGLVGSFMADGIFVSVENATSGTHPNINNSVEVLYEGKYVSDGKVFDSTKNGNTATFPLRNVIVGWQKGIPYFGIGEKGWLVLPANQAYGSFPPSGIRADAPMAFYIELISVK